MKRQPAEPPNALAIVLARAGSQGLPNKNALPCAGKPVLSWTLEHVAASNTVARAVLSTDGEEYKAIAAQHGVESIHRPHKLADDTATVDAAARHAVLSVDPDEKFQAFVILYGNVPVRPPDLTDCAVSRLLESGADSVQSVCPVGKHHPYWMKELGGNTGDVMLQHTPNQVYRRQDLPPLYELDGGVIAVTREALFTVDPEAPHAFLGIDRRAVVTRPGEVVDIDEAIDLTVAEAILKQRQASPDLRAAG